MLGCLVCFASCQPPNRNRTVNTHDDSQTTGQTPTQQATDAASSVTTKADDTTASSVTTKTGVDTTTGTTASSVTTKTGVDTATTTEESGKKRPTILEDVKEAMKEFKQDHDLYLEATALKEEIPKINTNINVEAFDHEFY